MNDVEKKKAIVKILSELPDKELERIFTEIKQNIGIDSRVPYAAFFTMDDAVRQKYNLYKLSKDLEQKKWVDTLKQIPKSVCIPNRDIKLAVEQAKKVWGKDICGNEQIRDRLILHLVEYIKTHKTTPVLFAGEPGCGKTYMAETYMKLMGLNTYLCNCPQETTHGHSLYGESQGYKEAGEGILIKAAIKTKTANPGIIFNEIDKIIVSSLQPNMHNDLLSLLDETSYKLVDNYCCIEYNASQYVIAFTANNINDISQPLLDRCEIIYVNEPDAEQIIDIILTKLLPSLMLKYNISVELDTDMIRNYIIDQYAMGNHSVRMFQTCLKHAMSNAYLRYITKDEKKFEITRHDMDLVMQYSERKNKKIGFGR